MISILSVNWNSLQWMNLLVKSIRKFTSEAYEIVIVDNGSEDRSVDYLKEHKEIKGIMLNHNIGHGTGLDLALKNASHEYCLVLDIDAHVQRENWDRDLISLYNSKIRLIAALGGKKFIHPCFMFFERKFFLENGLSFIAKDGFDVGRRIYHDIIESGFGVERISSGYEDAQHNKFYPGAWGDEYYIDGKATIYHNWYGSRFWKRKEVDHFKRKDFDEKKGILFSQPLVKEILGC